MCTHILAIRKKVFSVKTTTPDAFLVSLYNDTEIYIYTLSLLLRSPFFIRMTAIISMYGSPFFVLYFVGHCLFYVVLEGLCHHARQEVMSFNIKTFNNIIISNRVGFYWWQCLTQLGYYHFNFLCEWKNCWYGRKKLGWGWGRRADSEKYHLPENGCLS